LGAPKKSRLGQSPPSIRPAPARNPERPNRSADDGKNRGIPAHSGGRDLREILWRASHARRANDIPNAPLQTNVAEAMERAARGVHKANSLAEQIGEASFVAVMDKLQIESMATIPRLESLKSLVARLEEAARSVAWSDL
jgi:hypothetical protein